MERVYQKVVRRYACRGLLAALVLATLTVGPVPTQATAPDPVVRVEEDWELVLNEPDGSLTTPQFHTVMSPVGDLDSVYTQVTWNYRELPEFDAGGVEMQIWEGDDYVYERSFASVSLSTEAETIRWTQNLELDGGELVFTITDGTSTTWGSFGYPSHNMQVRYAESLPNLNGYRTSVSQANSVVTFGGNRVDRLVLKEVRRITQSGAVLVVHVDSVVFENGGD
ncbi:MAG: hypothetical protein J5J06_19410 [Phycisphaerae bacterium]|nr:hypothetical protein [Phycisphaerae bacterium]